MKSENLIYAAFVVILVSIAGFVVVKVATVSIQIITAIITLVGTIALSVFRYVFEIDQQRREQLQIAKRQNYQRIIEKILKFYTEGRRGQEHLIIANMESWVFGDREVVKKTLDLLDNPEMPVLLRLLSEMRTSVGLTEPGIEDEEILTKWDRLVM